MPESGKTTVAMMLKKKGFSELEMSDFIKELMRREHIAINGKNAEVFAKELKKKFGNQIVAKLMTKRLKKTRGNIVISGVRNINEFEYFRNLLHIKPVLIAIMAPPKMRYQRVRATRNMQMQSYKDFLLHDKRSLTRGTARIIKSADMIILNTGTISDLRKNVNMVINLINKQNNN